MTSVRKLVCLSLLIFTSLASTVQSFAQVQSTPQPQAAPQPQTPEAVDSASRENQLRPQVVTILHRLSGLKMFRLLLRSGDVRAVARLDEAFNLTGDVHTNVIAGLTLDDGETIAAWLPEAEAEFGPPTPPLAPTAPDNTGHPPLPFSPTQPADAPAFWNVATVVQPPDLTVIAGDGKRLVARYIGIDGVTGLSVLKLSSKSLAQTGPGAQQTEIGIGQSVNLFAPEPAAGSDTPSGIIFARMGQTEGKISNVTRAPSGGIARMKVKVGRISPALIGGIALNDVGETLGIVDAVDGQEATVLPAATIKGAAKRVLERQASVPRPWLGIRGEAIGALPLQQILLNGWKEDRALSLLEKQRGILLTSVAPGSPASEAALRPGDVILRVNDGEVRNAEEFSWLLEETEPGHFVRFIIARPGKPATEAVEVRLEESPFFTIRIPKAAAGRVRATRSTPGMVWSKLAGSSLEVLNRALITSGLETIALKRNAAARFGASSGLLVVFVQPSTSAARAGLRPGDLIESVDGRQIFSSDDPVNISLTPGASYSLVVVRNRQKISLTLKTNQ